MNLLIQIIFTMISFKTKYGGRYKGFDKLNLMFMTLFSFVILALFIPVSTEHSVLRLQSLFFVLPIVALIHGILVLKSGMDNRKILRNGETIKGKVTGFKTYEVKRKHGRHKVNLINFDVELPGEMESFETELYEIDCFTKEDYKLFSKRGLTDEEFQRYVENGIEIIYYQKLKNHVVKNGAVYKFANMTVEDLKKMNQ